MQQLNKFCVLSDDTLTYVPTENPNDMRERIVSRIITKQAIPERTVSVPNVQRRVFPDIRSRKRLSEDELANILGKKYLCGYIAFFLYRVYIFQCKLVKCLMNFRILFDDL